MFRDAVQALELAFNAGVWVGATMISGSIFFPDALVHNSFDSEEDLEGVSDDLAKMAPEGYLLTTTN